MDSAKNTSGPVWRGIDHVQVAIPPSGEPLARCHIDDPFGNRIELIDCSGPESP